MLLKEITLVVVLYALGIILVLQTGNAEGIRLCGKRLADILNFICEKHGGFHVPRIKRDVSSKSENLQSARTFMQSLMRRNDPSATTELSGVEFNHQRGVVDECCKKQCSLTTLVSYCANAPDITNVNLQEILASVLEPAISEEVKPGSPQVPVNNHRPSAPVNYSNRLAHSRPNLGLSNRDRSVFIVLSQLQEDDDKALGEYRF